MTKDYIYKTFIKDRHLESYHWLHIMWGVIGPVALFIFGLTEPWSFQFFNYAVDVGVAEWFIYFGLMPLVMILRAIIVVEAIGYLYHRFSEHLGFLTSLSSQVRKNQQNHWKHHMIDYPIGKTYIINKPYKKSQDGIAWEWAFPGFLILAILVYFQGVTFANVLFFFFSILYGLFVGLTHARFHVLNNPWSKNKYYNWLEDIHIIHHYDQATNYTITNPIMDIIFLTYVSPKEYKRFIQDSKKDKKIYASDIINWSYMMNFAWPKKYAIFISDIENNKKQKQKFKKILTELRGQHKKHENNHILAYYINRMETVASSIDL